MKFEKSNFKFSQKRPDFDHHFDLPKTRGSSPGVVKFFPCGFFPQKLFFANVIEVYFMEISQKLTKQLS